MVKTKMIKFRRGDSVIVAMSKIMLYEPAFGRVEQRDPDNPDWFIIRFSDGDVGLIRRTWMQHNPKAVKEQRK